MLLSFLAGFISGMLVAVGAIYLLVLHAERKEREANRSKVHKMQKRA